MHNKDNQSMGYSIEYNNCIFTVTLKIKYMQSLLSAYKYSGTSENWVLTTSLSLIIIPFGLSGVLGDSCVVEPDCSDSVNNSHCDSGFCGCKDGHIDIGDRTHCKASKYIL